MNNPEVMEVIWRFGELPPYKMACENQRVMADYGGMEVFDEMCVFCLFCSKRAKLKQRGFPEAENNLRQKARGVSEDQGIPSPR